MSWIFSLFVNAPGKFRTFDSAHSTLSRDCSRHAWKKFIDWNDWRAKLNYITEAAYYQDDGILFSYYHIPELLFVPQYMIFTFFKYLCQDILSATGDRKTNLSQVRKLFFYSETNVKHENIRSSFTDIYYQLTNSLFSCICRDKKSWLMNILRTYAYVISS